MRTATAWTSKLKSEAWGRTFKVQETNHRAMTGIAYRGAAMCYAMNYAQLIYDDNLKRCCNRNSLPSPPPLGRVLNGGSPSSISTSTLNGGTPSSTGTSILNGGNV